MLLITHRWHVFEELVLILLLDHVTTVVAFRLLIFMRGLLRISLAIVTLPSV